VRESSTEEVILLARGSSHGYELTERFDAAWNVRKRHLSSRLKNGLTQR